MYILEEISSFFSQFWLYIKGIVTHLDFGTSYSTKLPVAKELLSRVVNEAREYGCGSVWITASDMGVLLYTNFGFVKNGNFMQYKL